MVNQRRTEIKVGVVVIVALVIFGVGITLVRGCNVSVSKQYDVKFRFQNSGGLQISNPVVINGVKRGTVTSIKNDKGSVLVQATIDDIDDIYSDASAVITILEITGGKKIELMPGTKGQMFDPKNEIPGRAAADIADLVKIIGDMSGDMVKVFHRVDTLTAKLSEIVSADGFTDNVVGIVENTNEFIANAKVVLNQNIDEINSIIKDINFLTGSLRKDYERYEPRLDALINNLNEAVNSTNDLMAKLDKTVNSANSSLDDVNNITSEIRNGKGTLSRLIYDPNLSAKLDTTITNLNYLVNFLINHGMNVNVRLGTRP